MRTQNREKSELSYVQSVMLSLCTAELNSRFIILKLNFIAFNLECKCIFEGLFRSIIHYSDCLLLCASGGGNKSS